MLQPRQTEADPFDLPLPQGKSRPVCSRASPKWGMNLKRISVNLEEKICMKCLSPDPNIHELQCSNPNPYAIHMMCERLDRVKINYPLHYEKCATVIGERRHQH